MNVLKQIVEPIDFVGNLRVEKYRRRVISVLSITAGLYVLTCGVFLKATKTEWIVMGLVFGTVALIAGKLIPEE